MKTYTVEVVTINENGVEVTRSETVEDVNVYAEMIMGANEVLIF